MARANGYTLFLTANDAVFALHSRPAESDLSPVHPALALRAKSLPPDRDPGADSVAVVRMELMGKSSLPKAAAGGQLPGTVNYFLGHDPSQWHPDVARYARVSYQNVYPGVNLAFHGAQRQLEFDFMVAPGANPAPIGFHFTGARKMKTDESGDLVISSAAGDLLLRKPMAYQRRNGAHQAVRTRFVLKANHQVGFALGNYDHSRALLIDPSVSYAYSTYLGGSEDDEGYGIAFDSGGNAYVTGETDSTNFPGFSNSPAGVTNVFVTKISPDGSTLVYSTYVGGSGNDSGNAIAVDASGDVFVAGGTTSSDFPATAGAFQTALAGAENAFVCELGPNGSSVTYCTYLGGSGEDLAFGLAVDSSGNTYAVGSTSSTNFPTKNPIQASLAGTSNGFVTKLNPAGTALVYSTYLGGGSGDEVFAVALDSSDNAYLTGTTSSPSFPTTAGVVQPACGTDGTCNGGLSDAFVTVINTPGSAYVYSTFLGGSGSDLGNAIAVDSSDNAYVTGATESTDFPRQSPLYNNYGGDTDAFVTKLNPTGSALLYSTYLGGSGADLGAGIALDAGNNAYVTGQTSSSNFPVASPTQSTLGGGSDAFVTEINPAGSALAFSTFLGGRHDEDGTGKYGAIAVDSAGANIYVTGSTVSTNFPNTSAAYQTANAGLTDAFVVKYSQAGTSPSFSLTATALSPASVNPGGSANSTVTVTPANGFSGSVTLTCSVSPMVSLGPTCGAASATPSAPATLTVNTAAATALLRRPRHRRSSSLFYAMSMFFPVGGIALLGLGLGSTGSRRKKLFASLLIGLLGSALLLMPACGGGSSSSGGGGTPANTYTITVSGTATGATQTGTPPTLTLTVN
ncbi:MAG: SBBP repeat-containing protein [Candidatus Sulfotelmatobacter sp.]